MKDDYIAYYVYRSSSTNDVKVLSGTRNGGRGMFNKIKIDGFIIYDKNRRLGDTWNRAKDQPYYGKLHKLLNKYLERKDD